MMKDKDVVKAPNVSGKSLARLSHTPAPKQNKAKSNGNARTKFAYYLFSFSSVLFLLWIILKMARVYSDLDV